VGFIFPVVEIECQDNGCGGKEAKDKKGAISKKPPSAHLWEVAFECRNFG